MLYQKLHLINFKEIVMKQIMVVLVAALFFSASTFAQTYQVDTEKSVLKWKGEKVTGFHVGTVKIKEGKLVKNGERYSGEFVIDMTTIDNEDLQGEWKTKLLNHLRSDDFFSVEKYPTATFKVTKTALYKPSKGENFTHKVSGDLTIKGITNKISFPAVIEATDKVLVAEASFSIDRTEWNIQFRSGSFFENLGDKLIYDDIKFDLQLVANVVNEIATETMEKVSE
jgi:polyisoprenoid-binding protein YceI